MGGFEGVEVREGEVEPNLFTFRGAQGSHEELFPSCDCQQTKLSVWRIALAKEGRDLESAPRRSKLATLREF